MSSIDIDLDPFEAADEVPYDRLKELRRTCPVARIPTGWYLTRQADLTEAAKRVDTFAASFRAPGVTVPEEEQFINEIIGDRHARVRKAINASIAYHKAMRVEPFVRDLCNGYLDPLIGRGGGDLIGEMVVPIPMNVIAHLIGLPRADWEQFWRWSDEVVQGTYPTQYRNERGSGLAGAHPEFTAYVDRLIADRQKEADDGRSSDDLVTRLLLTEVDGRRLSATEVRSQLVFLIISGNETTRHLIGNLLATVATSAEIFAALKSDRSLVERAVEESLRFQPPVHVLLRNVIADTGALGAPMCQGEKVVFAVSAANRDEAVYEDPDAFRLDRPNWREHFAFGGGPHVCPGAALARLEAKVVLETVLDRVESLVVEDGWSRRKVPVFWANGPVDLPVHISVR